MPSNVYDRRKFLKMVGVAGFVPLIGTANTLGRSLPAHAESIKGPANSVIIPTHEWTGDINERLDFPADWQLEVMEMKGANAPPLDELQIGQRLDQPIGTLPLQGIVSGRRRIVITFDDLTRPTPMYTVMPWILGELRAARFLARLLYRHRRIRHGAFRWQGQELCDFITRVIMGESGYREALKQPSNYLKLLGWKDVPSPPPT